MVNKGSFFQRLKDRWGSASGVHVEQAAGREPVTGDTPVKKSASDAQSVVAERSASGLHDGSGNRTVSSTFQPAEARSSRKMSDREEAMMAFGQHFQELTQLVGRNQAASEDRLKKIVDATTCLPSLGDKQVDLLDRLLWQVKRQNELGASMTSALERLPSLLEHVEKSLARATTTDERTAATVRDFQLTMGKFQSSMETLATNSSKQADATKELVERRAAEFDVLAKDLSQAQENAVGELKRTNDESLKSLRRTHEDQSNRLQRVVQEHAGWNRAVLVGIGLVVMGIGALIVLQLMG